MVIWIPGINCWMVPLPKEVITAREVMLTSIWVGNKIREEKWMAKETWSEFVPASEGVCSLSSGEEGVGKKADTL
jgi:hypothetical protein